MTDAWLQIPGLHDKYLKTLDRLGLFQLTGVHNDERKLAESECWKIRAEAFRILVAAKNSGYDEESLEAEAGAFSWSLEQLDNEALREWLVAL
jgi:hypothetical protein